MSLKTHVSLFSQLEKIYQNLCFDWSVFCLILRRVTLEQLKKYVEAQKLLNIETRNADNIFGGNSPTSEQIALIAVVTVAVTLPHHRSINDSHHLSRWLS